MPLDGPEGMTHGVLAFYDIHVILREQNQDHDQEFSQLREACAALHQKLRDLAQVGLLWT